MLAALLLAGAVPDLAATDRAIAAGRARLSAVEAPLLRLSGAVALLAMAPSTPERGRRLALGRAWLRAASPPVLARAEAIRADLATLQERRARALLLAGLRAAGTRVAGPLLAPFAPCATAVLRPPAEGPALAAPVAAALGRGAGLVLVATPGAAVVAPAAGRVAYAGRFRRYGDIVVIDHGHGWTSLVTGLAGVAVTADTPVAAGARLGAAPAGLPLVGLELGHGGAAVDAAALMRRCVR